MTGGAGPGYRGRVKAGPPARQAGFYQPAATGHGGSIAAFTSSRRTRRTTWTSVAHACLAPASMTRVECPTARSLRKLRRRIEPSDLSQGARVVPGHPRRRVLRDALLVTLQCDDVAEDVDLGELGALDEISTTCNRHSHLQCAQRGKIRAPALFCVPSLSCGESTPRPALAEEATAWCPSHAASAHRDSTPARARPTTSRPDPSNDSSLCRALALVGNRALSSLAACRRDRRARRGPSVTGRRRGWPRAGTGWARRAG
jgi:hypothetical protein